MSGLASALFVCKAVIDPATDAEATCDAFIVLDLINDGQYTNYTEPIDWHIRLGFTPEETVVRCPEHCTWTKLDDHGYPLPGGSWELAP